MDDALHERVDALERAITDDDREFTGLTDVGEHDARLDSLEADLAELEDRVAELDAATQALRGYVGNIRSVNRDVEQRAETALATAQAVERALDETTATAGRCETGDQRSPTVEPADDSTGDDLDPAGRDGDQKRPEGNLPRRDGDPPAADDTLTTPADGKPGAATPGGRSDPAAASSPPEPPAASHCPECGTRHEGAHTGAEIAIDGTGTVETAGSGPEPSLDEEFCPGDPEETGALRRIRELL